MCVTFNITDWSKYLLSISRICISCIKEKGLLQEPHPIPTKDKLLIVISYGINDLAQNIEVEHILWVSVWQEHEKQSRKRSTIYNLYKQGETLSHMWDLY